MLMMRRRPRFIKRMGDRVTKEVPVKLAAMV
jgi:hypothetical protein